MGQNKINPAGQQLLDNYKLELTNRQTSGMLLAPSQTPKEDILLKLASGADVNKLIDLGLEIYTQIEDIIAGSIPFGQIESLAALPDVACIEFGVEYNAYLDIARPAGSVTEVQDGFDYDGATHSYSGKGVVAGMMDIGLEANHVNFLKEDGESRIQRLWHFTGTTGNSSRRVYFPDTIFQFDCDSKTETHATHVGGIMSGSYNGSGTFYKNLSPTQGGRTKYVDKPVPFYGIATDADLAFAVGPLHNTNIVAGVGNIVEYAKSMNQPVVVNLSLGSTYGPHDGSDLVGQALAKYGKEAIICVASGNEAEDALSVEKSFTTSDNELKVQFKDNKASGIVDFWGNDATPFTFQWAVYNQGTRTLEIISEINPGTTTTIDSKNATFNKYFSGSIKVTSGVSTTNNRYQVYSACTSVTGKNSSARLAVVITGVTGQTAYGYSQETSQFDPSLFLVGWTAGSTENSINDMACGENVLSVGSYNSKSQWTNLSGGNYSIPGCVVGEISPFSSYGMNFQGQLLPEICAPGCAIISSGNRAWVLSKGASERVALAQNPLDLQDDYWIELQGTSMAAPYVSGVVALWLEACPELTCANVKEILSATATRDIQVENYPEKFGYGKINALEGIKYILKNYSSVGTIVDESKALIVEAVDGGYSVFVGGEQALAASLYDLQGREVSSVSAAANELTVPTSALSAGVYVLKVNGANATYTRKINVK